MTFLALDIDPTETAAMVRAYRQSTGFPWTYAMSTAAITQRFDVVQTDTKYVVDSTGTILYQDGYGAESADRWRTLLRRVTGDER